MLGAGAAGERELLTQRLARAVQAHHRVVGGDPRAGREIERAGPLEVDPSQTHLYGIATVEPTGVDDVVRVTGLVEKPPPGEAPSNLAIIGRYVLRPEIFEVLERTEPGKGGEIQLTDALQEMAADPDGPGVYGVVFRGRRYDTGDRVDYIKAIVQLAADRDDLGPELRPWFKDFAAKL